ncbi:DUF3592 domain-containing protein [Hymenobacter pini]|uniref:DUF3592 domain-containing protein n=1 Tax=Hymenobacter pini TaxID=2880879 RepID=UPI001CF54EB8|nr:DUF3592 domain-containing protein [Hymenobacter pini]MCA8832764.1 DUF3592 domain-containing protein [Hymenobacter pini]
MARESSFSFWLRAWVQPLIASAFLLSMLWLAAQRWRTLHGTPATAIVHALPGRIGSGKSSTYEVVVNYELPQERLRLARVLTNQSAFEQLTLGDTVGVRYAKNQAKKPLLASEWSFSGGMIVLSLGSLFFFFTGLQANKDWRGRRRAGYLP